MVAKYVFLVSGLILAVLFVIDNFTKRRCSFIAPVGLLAVYVQSQVFLYWALIEPVNRYALFFWIVYGAFTLLVVMSIVLRHFYRSKKD